MKRISIILITIALSGSMIVLYEGLLKNIPNEYQYKNDYLEANSSEIETLILGNSHAYYGIDPMCFQGRTFNASYVSQSLNYDYAIMNKFKFDNLKNVIIPISYFSLYTQIGKGCEDNRGANYKIYYGFSENNTIIDILQATNTSFDVSFRRIFSYYISHQNLLSCDSMGYMMHLSRNCKPTINEAQIVSQRHKSYIKPDLIRENSNILETLVSNYPKVKFYFIIPPYTSYYNALRHAETYKETVQTLSKLSANYPNCLFQNFSEDPNFVDSDFFDVDHLNAHGAAKFSNILNNLIYKDSLPNNSNIQIAKNGVEPHSNQQIDNLSK